MDRVARIGNYPRLRRIESRLDIASSYDEWLAHARNCDRHSGADHWKLREESRLYDAAQLRERYDKLANLCADRNIGDYIDTIIVALRPLASLAGRRRRLYLLSR